MFQWILKTLLLTGMKENSYFAITSNQICMYISKNRYKNHVPCGRRQLIKTFASIKHICKKDQVAKLFSVLLGIDRLAKTEIHWHQGEVIRFFFTAAPVFQTNYLYIFHWQCTCLSSSNHQNPLGIMSISQVSVSSKEI